MNIWVILIGLFFFGTSLKAQDLSELFKMLTNEEIALVQDEWARRDVKGYQFEWVAEREVLGYNHVVFSHAVYDSQRHYGLVRYPKDFDSIRNYPVLIINHGGRNGIGSNAFNRYEGFCYDSCFLLAASYRGESVDATRIGLAEYVSEGDPFAHTNDKDVDDVLAMINAFLDYESSADPTRMVSFGSSRGGGVNYLASIRDRRIRAANTWFGSSDLITFPDIQLTMDLVLNQGASKGPVYGLIKSEIVEPYLDGVYSLEEARLALLKRSAFYFTELLPKHVLIQHGSIDSTVDVRHSRLLDDKLKVRSNSIADGRYTYIEYSGVTHSFTPVAQEAFDARGEFLCDIIRRASVDSDGDGVVDDDDCDDANPDIYPGAEDIPNNGIDEDCDGEDAVLSQTNDEEAPSFLLFPNPTTSSVEFISESTVQSISAWTLGQHRVALIAGHNFSVMDWPKGVYFLKVEFMDRRGVWKKLVVE